MKKNVSNQGRYFNFHILLILFFILTLIGCASDGSEVRDTGSEVSVTPNPEPQTSDPGKQITDITATVIPGSADILIKGNRTLTYTSTRQPSPPAVILNFSDTGLALSDPSKKELNLSESDLITSVKASDSAEGGTHSSRIEISLKKDIPSDIARELETGIRVSVGSKISEQPVWTKDLGTSRPDLTPPVPTKNYIPKTRTTVLEVWDPKLKAWVPEQTLTEDVPETSQRVPDSQISAAKPESPDATRVETVYATRSDKGMKVSVGADGAIRNYKAFTIASPARIVFDLFNLKSPYKEEKRVPVNSEWVSQVRYFAYPDRLRVVLDTEKQWLSEFAAYPAEDGLVIQVGPSAKETQTLPVAVFPAATRLQSIYADQSENSTLITVKGNGTITDYKTSVIENPPGIAVDIFNIAAPYKAEQSFPVDTRWVKTVRYTGGPDKLHLIIDTDKEYLSSFSASPDKDGLIIRVGDIQGSGIAKTVEKTPPPLSVTTPRTQDVPASPRVPGIDYTLPAKADVFAVAAETAGKSSLVIETSRPVQYELTRAGDRKLRLTLLNTDISERYRRSGPVETTNLESAVNRITLLKETPKHTAVFEIDLREDVPFFADQSDESGKNRLLVHFEASSVPPGPAAVEIAGAGQRSEVRGTGIPVTGPKRETPGVPQPTAATDTKPGVPQPYAATDTKPGIPQPYAATDTKPGVPQPYAAPAPDAVFLGKGSPQSPQSHAVPQWAATLPGQAAALPAPGASAADVQMPDLTPKYTGEKIALDFYETDVKNVFRILREVSGKNFAIDGDVKGKVTLTLDKPVPWDQVLDLVLKMNQLGRTYEGDIIRIATHTTLQKEEKIREEKKVAEQTLKEQQKALEPLFTEYIAISYSNAQTEIQPHLEKIMTKDRGTVSVDTRTNMVIMTDTAAKIRQAKEIVDKLDRVTPQVIIEARIVEATASFSKEIGTSWGMSSGLTDTTVAAGALAQPGRGPQRSYDLLGGTYGYDLAMNSPLGSSIIAKSADGSAAALGFNFLRIAGSPLVLNAKLAAMESQGKGKIISAPKIATLDNKKALIKQGLRYPYQTVDDGKISKKFEDVTLNLEVTPHVTPDNRISLTVMIKKNDIGDIIGGEQSFMTKEANTELLVNDGETVVIGGIIKSSERRNNDGIPGLSQIPLLGWFFKAKSNIDSKDELLIFITPRIVQLEQRQIRY